MGRSNDGRVLRVLEEPETSRGWLDCGGKMGVEGLVSNKAGVKAVNLIRVGFEKPLENDQIHLWSKLCLESDFAIRVRNG